MPDLRDQHGGDPRAYRNDTRALWAWAVGLVGLAAVVTYYASIYGS